MLPDTIEIRQIPDVTNILYERKGETKTYDPKFFFDNFNNRNIVKIEGACIDGGSNSYILENTRSFEEFVDFESKHGRKRNGISFSDYVKVKLQQSELEVKDSFKQWLTPETRGCIKTRKKSVNPEDEDLERLAEAIVNKNESGLEIVFVTGDSHFICNAENIKKEYNIQVVNLRNSLP